MKTQVFKDYSNQQRFVLGTITKSKTEYKWLKKIIHLEGIGLNL